MEHQSLLIGLSQIGIVYAGLISIFVIFAARDGEFQAHEKLHVVGIVVSCLALLIGSLSPFAFHVYGLSGDLLWRCSSAAAIVWGGALSIRAFRPYLKMSKAERRKVSYFHAVFAYGLNIVNLVLLFAAVAGLAPSANYIMFLLLTVPAGMSSFVTFAQQKFIGKF